MLRRSKATYNMDKLEFYQSNSDTKMENNPKKTISENNSEFEYKGYYKFGRVLGRGRFGTVIECLRKSDNQTCAMKFFQCAGIHRWIPANISSEKSENWYNSKSINSSSYSMSNYSMSQNDESVELPSEVACLLRASNIPGIVKIVDYLPVDDNIEDINDDEGIIGIVLERDPNEICLFDYLLHKNVLSESEARFIIKQLIQINLRLLEVGILHGDLKSENILIEPRTKKIKLIDFGSAQLIDSPGGKFNSKLVKTFRGTNLYKPPEYLLNKCFYARPSTVWTIGVILYDMVCGRFPFVNDKALLEHKYTEVEFLGNWKNLSPGFKNLIQRCLNFYVADRINIDKILYDPWMTSES